MIRSTAVGKVLGIAGLLALAVVGVMLTLILTAQGGETPPVVLDGIPLEEFTDSGVLLTPAESGETPPLAAQDAVVEANRLYPGGVARQTLLVEVKSIAVNPPLDHLAWIVNFDPNTVAESPPNSTEAPAGPYQTIYAYALIDARSGQLIFGGSKTAPVSPLPIP